MPANAAGDHTPKVSINDLPASVDPCGERGEFHSCVYAGPMFSEPVALEASLRDALSAMTARRADRLPVCDAEGQRIGVIALPDLVR